jgi:hypothetical protein
MVDIYQRVWVGKRMWEKGADFNSTFTFLRCLEEAVNYWVWLGKRMAT